MIDRLERRELPLSSEETALSAEKDEAGQARLSTVRTSLQAAQGLTGRCQRLGDEVGFG